MFVFETFSVYAHDTVATQAWLYFFFVLYVDPFFSLSCHLLSSFICWPFETFAIFCLGLFLLNLWWGCTCICRVAAFYVGYICFGLSLFTCTLDTDFLLPILRIVFCVISARSLSLRSHCLFSILRISPTESKWFDFRSTTFLAESLFFLDSLTSEYFKRFMCLEEIGDMSKKYMHIWGNTIPFKANSLSSERNKGFQPVLCLVPKCVNRFFRGPGIYLIIQTSEISPLDISVQVFGCDTLQSFFW